MSKGQVRIIFPLGGAANIFFEQTKSTTKRLNDLSQMTQLASDKISKHLKESHLKGSLFHFVIKQIVRRNKTVPIEATCCYHLN